MTTIKLTSRFPVQTNEDDMRAHCAAFGLTLRSWGRSDYELEVIVDEEVSSEKLRQIVTAMRQHLLDTVLVAEIVSVEPSSTDAKPQTQH